MINLRDYEVVGFYYRENNVLSSIDESEIFYHAYSLLIEMVEANIQYVSTMGTAISPKTIDIDKYLRKVREFKEHYIVRLRDKSSGSIKDYHLSPRRDSRFLNSLRGINGYLTKIPGAIIFRVYQ